MAFLNTGDAWMRDGFGWLVDRVKERLCARDEWADVIPTDAYNELNVRVAEYHRQIAPGPGINDFKHYDMDSIVTVDICLSSANEFSGGTFGTLETNGELMHHSFGKGDAVAFISHKFHCVEKVTEGVRRVLVLELWRGPTRTCPHRCEFLGNSCPSESTYVQPTDTQETLLPFRLGGVEGEKLLWQSNVIEKVTERRKGNCCGR